MNPQEEIQLQKLAHYRLQLMTMANSVELFHNKECIWGLNLETEYLTQDGHFYRAPSMFLDTLLDFFCELKSYRQQFLE